MIEATLGRLAAGEDLSQEEMAASIEAVMAGELTDGQIGILLTALRAKGETAAEIAGAASVLRRHMTPIRSQCRGLVDTCGTGGDGSGTFNISTAAALVAAAAGVPVAKHGNRGITSKTGSADALAALGVNINATVQQVEACLDKLGICFCFAPLLHASMKRVAQVRKTAGRAHDLQPAGAAVQSGQCAVSGAGRRAAPNCGRCWPRRCDCWAPNGPSSYRAKTGSTKSPSSAPRASPKSPTARCAHFTWTPADFGLQPASLDSIRVAGPEQSAAMIRQVLAGDQGHGSRHRGDQCGRGAVGRRQGRHADGSRRVGRGSHRQRRRPRFARPTRGIEQSLVPRSAFPSRQRGCCSGRFPL